MTHSQARPVTAPINTSTYGFRRGTTIHRCSRLLGALSLFSLATACNLNFTLNGDGSKPSPDGTYTSAVCQSSATPIPRENEGNWTLVVLNDVIPGDEQFTCGNGDPYKFFVQFNTGATDLTVALEPGGACWDYESCNYQAGVLNPVRLEAVPDDLMINIDYKPWAAMYPHFGRIDNSVPTNKYNHVFFPYCTGDAFTGDTVKTYTKGENSITVNHHGRRNLEAAAEWLSATFPSDYTGQLLVVGSSAGAVGAATNYPLLRDAVGPKCGAMLSDSGPIFPPSSGAATTNQDGLLDLVGAAWDLRSPGGIVEQLDDRLDNEPNRLVNDHFGHVNAGLARTYPNDRFLFTTFKQDLNFSIFSFVSDGPIAPGDGIANDVLDMWESEVDQFKTWIENDAAGNWGYYLPNYRPDFCSHMVATAPLSLVHDRYGYARSGVEGHADGYYRTEIGDMNLGDAIRQLLDPSQPLPRVEATEDPNQLSFRSEPGVGVQTGGTWYNLDSGARISDAQLYVDQQRVSCVFTNGYPY